MTALSLVAYTVVLGLTGGRWLAGSTWVRRAPALAIFVWQMLCAATVTAVGVLGLSSVLHVDDNYSVMCRAWQVCLDAIRGAHGTLAQVVAVAGALLLVGVAGRLTVAGWGLVGAERRQRTRLRTAMRLAGRRMATLNATVVPSPHPAAYLVPGSRPDVVVTSGAVHRLSHEELRAVMAHERAHASGRHYWLLRPVRLLFRAFPGVPLFALAVVQVHRLVELRADDVAIRVSQPLTLARALVSMAQGRAGPAAAAAGAVAAWDGQRGHRPRGAPAGAARSGRGGRTLRASGLINPAYVRYPAAPGPTYRRNVDECRPGPRPPQWHPRAVVGSGLLLVFPGHRVHAGACSERFCGPAGRDARRSRASTRNLPSTMMARR